MRDRNAGELDACLTRLLTHIRGPMAAALGAGEHSRRAAAGERGDDAAAAAEGGESWDALTLGGAARRLVLAQGRGGEVAGRGAALVMQDLERYIALCRQLSAQLELPLQMAVMLREQVLEHG